MFWETIGEIVGRTIYDGAIQWLSGDSGASADAELDSEVRYVDDDVGRRVWARFERPLPAGSQIAVHLTTPSGAFVQAVEGFCDGDGDLSMSASTKDGWF